MGQADVIAYENVPCSANLLPDDIAYLKRLLRGALMLQPGAFVVRHRVGHVALPSGQTLRIRSLKTSAASVIAWAAYLNPLLRSLRILGAATKASDEADVAALVAKLFMEELDRAVRSQGLTHAYRRQHVESALVRGRIDFARLVRRAGNASRLPCEVWERRPDSAAMRLLAATIDRITRDPVMRTVDPGLLHRLQVAFHDVSPDVDPLLLDGRTVAARTEHAFGPSLALARLVLRHIGLGDGDRHAGLSYLVRLDVLFERTVVKALQEDGLDVVPKRPLAHTRLTSVGDVSAGESQMYLDAWCGALAPGGVVVDAKYKDKVASADLHQMLAYCSLTGANIAVLVVPNDRVEDRRSYRFRRRGASPVTVHVVELDVQCRDVAAWAASARSFAHRAAVACSVGPERATRRVVPGEMSSTGHLEPGLPPR